MAWVAPRTFVAGEAITAAIMNQWRDQLSAIATAGITGWEAFTPTWTSTGSAPSVGDGTLAGTYCQIGKLLVFEANFTDGSTTGEGTGNYSWTLPVTAEAAARSGGFGHITDNGTGDFATTLDLATTTTFSLYTGGTTQTIAGQTSPMTWTTGDTFYVWAAYEAA